MTLPFVPAYAFPPGGQPDQSGDPAASAAAFTTAYRLLRARIEAFLALPLPELLASPDRLQAALDQIGQLNPQP